MKNESPNPTGVPHIRHSRGSGNPVTLVHILFNNLLDTRFRGYDIFFILDFYVHLQLTII